MPFKQKSTVMVWRLTREKFELITLLQQDHIHQLPATIWEDQRKSWEQSNQEDHIRMGAVSGVVWEVEEVFVDLAEVDHPQSDFQESIVPRLRLDREKDMKENAMDALGNAPEKSRTGNLDTDL